jgi:hypothetical protein
VTGQKRETCNGTTTKNRRAIDWENTWLIDLTKTKMDAGGQPDEKNHDIVPSDSLEGVAKARLILF